MDLSLHSIFDARLPKHRKIELFKILFQFILMTLCACVIGIIVSQMLDVSFYESAQRSVSLHFEALFLGMNGFREVLTALIKYCLWELVCIAVVFCISFSVINYAVTDMVLVFSGFRTGFSISFLAHYLQEGRFVYSPGGLRFAVFLSVKIVLMILLFLYAYKAAAYSASLRFSSGGRLCLKPMQIFPFCVFTLAYVGSVMIVSGAYCLVIYFIK